MLPGTREYHPRPKSGRGRDRQRKLVTTRRFARIDVRNIMHGIGLMIDFEGGGRVLISEVS